MISKWICENNLSTNIYKSKFMAICKHYKLSIIDNKVKIYINDWELDTEIKYLGVIIGDNLNFKLHYNNVFKTVSIKIYLFRRSKL